MSQNKQNSDISDAGSLLALGDLGLNFNKVEAEKEENKQDQKSRNNITLYDVKNRLIISIDQGVHGANKERLKRWSKLHHRTESDNSKHGCHNMGAKANAAYHTNLFRDETCGKKLSLNPKVKQILDKKSIERTPVEILQTTVTIISKTDEYDPVNEVELNQINLDFITPIYNGGVYSNEPQSATPLSCALWDKFSIEEDMPGTITITPVSDKRHNDLIEYYTTTDISKNHIVFLSTTYSAILEEGTKIENGLIEMDITRDNGIININTKPATIPGLNCSTIKSIPFDLLHYNNPNIQDKMEAFIYVYSKKKFNEEPSKKVCEILDKLPDRLTIIETDNGYKKCDKNNKNECTTKPISKKDLDNELQFYDLSCQLTSRGSYCDNWEILDKKKLRELFKNNEFVDKLINLDHLNGHNLNRNNKTTTRLPPPHKKSGDFSVRKVYENTRFTTNYDAKLDEHVPPLLQKSETKYEDWPEYIRGPNEWIQENFRHKLSKKYKEPPVQNIVPAKPAIIVPPKPNKVLIIESDTEEENTIIPNISLTVTESESDSESESESKSESKSESESESESDPESTTNNNISLSTKQEIINEIIEPEIVYRSESLAEYANKDKIIKALCIWISKPQHYDKLNDALENLYKVHRLIDLDVFTDIYSKLTIEEKVDIFKKKVNKRYLFDTDDIDEGSKFLRAYNACINN